MGRALEERDRDEVRAEKGEGRGKWCTLCSKHSPLPLLHTYVRTYVCMYVYLMNGVVAEAPSNFSSCPISAEGGSSQALIQVSAPPHFKGIGT